MENKILTIEEIEQKRKKVIELEKSNIKYSVDVITKAINSSVLSALETGKTLASVDVAMLRYSILVELEENGLLKGNVENLFREVIKTIDGFLKENKLNYKILFKENSSDLVDNIEIYLI